MAGRHNGNTYGTAVTEDLTLPLDEDINSPEIAAQLSSQVMVFDGVKDFINVDNQSALSFSGETPYTIEAWINPEDNVKEMHIVSIAEEG